MSEFELHQLIQAARYEFDLASVALVLVSLGFVLIAQNRRSDWSARTTKLVTWAYGITGALILIRIVASMVRFGKLNLLLEANDPSFVVSFAPLQVPTLMLRISFIIATVVMTMHFIKAPQERRHD